MKNEDAKGREGMKTGREDVKAWLGEAARMERGLEALMERQRRYRELGKARTGDSPGLEALEEEIGERIERYAARVRGIEKKIDALDDPMQREVLRYRYLNGWRWQVIAARTGLSREWLWKLHARALEEIGAGGETGDLIRPFGAPSPEGKAFGE